ncbi:MAG: hypothetical protein H7838_00250 [Magnetococcus sp. DMHC-8]
MPLLFKTAAAAVCCGLFNMRRRQAVAVAVAFQNSRSRCLLRPFQHAPQAGRCRCFSKQPQPLFAAAFSTCAAGALIIVSASRVSKLASLPAAHAEDAEAKTASAFLLKSTATAKSQGSALDPPGG